MKQVVIFGTGDFAQVARVYLDKDSPRDVAAFTVDEKHIKNKKAAGLDVFPFENILETHPPDRFDMFVAVGFRRVNRARAEIYGKCKEMGYDLISYVSTRASVLCEAPVGDNCFIFENNVIQPFARIGGDVIIWSGNHIGHHAEIGDHCFIASHAVISGRTKVGPYTFVGVNATLRDGITISAGNIIGAGAVILKDTRDGEVYSVRGTPPAEIAADDVESFK
jgi:sugar O-acyltransferase (sialic acid O-acetyltransferase NeuD family)